MRLRSALLTLVLAVAGCPSPDPSTGPAAPSGSPGERTHSSGSSLPAERPPPPPPFANKLDPLPPLAEQVVRKEGPKGLVTQARLLLGQLTPGDGVRLMLGWDTIGKRQLDGEHPLGKQQVDWGATFASIKVLIRSADGPWRVLEAGPGAGRAPRLPLHQRSAVVLRLDDTGLHAPDAEPHRWTEPAARLLAGPGKHRLKLLGRLALEQGALPFEMAEVELQVGEQSKELLPIDEIEAIAGRQVAQQLQLEQAPRPGKATVEDAAGHRVVRFRLASGGRYDLDFVEVVVARNGEVLAQSRKKVHNQAVATPEGLAVASDSWSTLYLRPTTPEPPAGEEQQKPSASPSAASD